VLNSFSGDEISFFTKVETSLTSMEGSKERTVEHIEHTILIKLSSVPSLKPTCSISLISEPLKNIMAEQSCVRFNKTYSSCPSTLLT
jgi:hypothetical protein